MITLLKITPPEGTPPWDAFDGADAEYYDLLVGPVSSETYARARITERALWLDDRKQCGAWYLAFEEIDKQYNIGSLMRLLSSTPPTSRMVRDCFADLLERYQFRTRGKQNIKEKQDLVGLLVSNEPVSPAAQKRLGDLLTRCDLKRKRGKQATPLYERTVEEWRRELGMRHVEYLVGNGISRDDAITRVSKTRALNVGVLRSDRDGSSGVKRRLGKLRQRLRTKSPI